MPVLTDRQKLEFISECEDAGFAEVVTECLIEDFEYADRKQRYSSVEDLWADIEDNKNA